jgi:UDP-glucose 4-epimerase
VSAASELQGTSVLVTGASGFIGSHLCRRLLKEGASVHAVSRQFRESGGDGLRWWKADLGNVAEVHALVQSAHPQIIFHLASHVAGARDLSMVLPTFNDNLASTVHLLTAGTEQKCRRIVMAQSSEEPLQTDGVTIPCSPYAAAKWAGGAYGRMFHTLFHTPVVMPRIFMTYGPDQKDLNKLVPYVTLSLLRGQAPQLTSGSRLADWIYVEDVVEGLVRSAVVPGLEGCGFDLGFGQLASVREVAQLLGEIVASGVNPKFGTVPDRPLEQQRPADPTFAATRLAWTPSTSLREGLAATVHWYRETSPSMGTRV